MVLNERKCHFMCLGNNTENETFLFITYLWKMAKNKNFSVLK